MISSVSLVTQTMNDISKLIAQILKVRASYPKEGINPFEWTTSLNSFHKQCLIIHNTLCNTHNGLVQDLIKDNEFNNMTKLIES